MSLTSRVYVRQVYTFLEFLGELGGLFGALTPLCMMVVTAFQYQSSYQFVMAAMFIDHDGKKEAPATSRSRVEGKESHGSDQQYVS